MRDIRSEFLSQTYNYSSDNFIDDTKLNNDFNYQENIYSAYATLSGAVKTFGYQAGLRAEDANTFSRLITTGENYASAYFNFFPSLHLSKKLKKNQELQLSYSRRINRPNTRSLNPFKDYSDPYNIRYGNPNLKPEYINSYELSYMKYWEKTILTTTAYYRKTNGIIQRLKTIGDSIISYITFVNLNSSTSYGFELISKTDIAKWWNVTASVNIFQTVIDGSNVDADLQNNNTSYMLKLLSNMRVWKNIDIQIAANYIGPSITPQGTMKEIFTIDLGAKKDVFKNASLSFNIVDITNARKMAWSANGTNFNQTMERRRESRIATLTFTYRFGKLTENSKSKKQNRQGGELNGGDDMGM